jgi:hypothetical protein
LFMGGTGKGKEGMAGARARGDVTVLQRVCACLCVSNKKSLGRALEVAEARLQNRLLTQPIFVLRRLTGAPNRWAKEKAFLLLTHKQAHTLGGFLPILTVPHLKNTYSQCINH